MNQNNSWNCWTSRGPWIFFSSSSQSSTGGDHALGMLDLTESTKIALKNGRTETQTVYLPSKNHDCCFVKKVGLSRLLQNLQPASKDINWIRVRTHLAWPSILTALQTENSHHKALLHQSAACCLRFGITCPASGCKCNIFTPTTCQHTGSVQKASVSGEQAQRVMPWENKYSGQYTDRH